MNNMDVVKLILKVGAPEHFLIKDIEVILSKFECDFVDNQVSEPNSLARGN